MASPFSSGSPPEFTKEQKKLRKLAWKPSANRANSHKPSEPTVVFRSEERQAELDALKSKKDAK